MSATYIIFTSLLNFKDVLAQKNMSYGVIWCDEGVYEVAKELQLLKPLLFGSIFYLNGPFSYGKDSNVMPRKVP